MKESCRTIYQLARILADLSQSEAARLLSVSVRSLGDYEVGNRIPHSDVVADMVQIYGITWLGYEHLRQSTELGMEILQP